MKLSATVVQNGRLILSTAEQSAEIGMISFVDLLLCVCQFNWVFSCCRLM